MKKLLFAFPVVVLLAVGCNSSQQASNQTPAPTHEAQNTADPRNESLTSEQRFAIEEPKVIQIINLAMTDPQWSLPKNITVASITYNKQPGAYLFWSVIFSKGLEGGQSALVNQFLDNLTPKIQAYLKANETPIEVQENPFINISYGIDGQTTSDMIFNGANLSLPYQANVFDDTTNWQSCINKNFSLLFPSNWHTYSLGWGPSLPPGPATCDQDLSGFSFSADTGVDEGGDGIILTLSTDQNIASLDDFLNLPYVKNNEKVLIDTTIDGERMVFLGTSGPGYNLYDTDFFHNGILYEIETTTGINDSTFNSFIKNFKFINPLQPLPSNSTSTTMSASTSPLSMGMVESPSIGDQWALGSTHTITWVPDPSVVKVNIYLVGPGACPNVLLGGDTCTISQIIASGVPDIGSYSWTLGDFTFNESGDHTDYRIFVSDVADPNDSTSSSRFSVLIANPQ